jgi:hypothetical protein
MTRRTAHPALPLALPIALLALLSLAVPVAAKEGMAAELDAPVSRDAEPGSTVEVGFDVYVEEPSGRFPVQGSPLFIRLVPPDRGGSREARAREMPSGSGHYVASVVVPRGGIDRVEIGLRGESCDATGCRRSDMLVALVGDVLVAGSVPGAVAGAPSAAATAGTVTATAQPASLGGPAASTPLTSPDSGPGALPFLGGGAVILALAAIAVFAVRRRSAKIKHVEGGPFPI